MTNGRHHDWGDDGGLGPTLDAYADARLRADVERTGVARARVMAAARARSRAMAQAPARRRWPAWPPLARTPLLAGATLLIVAGLAGGALAAGAPGGPLYGARLWVEELMLPAGPEERAAAEVGRLEERLAEAVRAAESSDVNAVLAALDEYRATAEEALARAGDVAARRALVVERLGRHVAVLQALAARVPDRAAAAIHDAIDRTEAHLEELLRDEPGRPESTPKPEATPKPEKTPPGKPEATPKPEKTPPGKPEATPKPEKTPPGKPEATPMAEATPERDRVPSPRP